MYLNGGHGVPRDFVSAHMWFNLADRGGVDAITNRDIAAAKMNPEQIAEAKKRFAEWRPILEHWPSTADRLGRGLQ
jgi:uncharacterized protein